MNILIVVATELEAKNLLNKVESKHFPEQNLYYCKRGKTCFDLLITGIGAVNTSYFLTKILQKKKYLSVWNIGVAGSFSNNLMPGEVVNVVSDCFADLGAEKDDELMSVFDLNLADKNEYPFENGIIKNSYKSIFLNLKEAKGITVNKASGTESTISVLRKKYNADTESMEGAAVAYICSMEKVSYLQIRAISNYVAPRLLQNWDLSLALNNLHEAILYLIETYGNEKE